MVSIQIQHIYIHFQILIIQIFIILFITISFNLNQIHINLNQLYFFKQMQELSNLVASRFRRIEQVTKTRLQTEYFRMLKEQEKMRCEKQNFLLNILKVSKKFNNNIKMEYFERSIQIMKIMNNNFQFKSLTSQTITQNFLDSFVGLYKTFFQSYEEAFQFKTHIQNFLRPTNHNVINDLIKYLIDFSRDYYQQTVMWHHKKKTKQHQAEIDRILLEDKNKKLRPMFLQTVKINNPIKNLPSDTIPYSTIQVKKKKEKDVKIKQVTPIVNFYDLYKTYDILNIWYPSPLTARERDFTPQIIKMKVNEAYRDLKLRNFLEISTYDKYRQKYNSKFSGENIQSTKIIIDEDCQCFPYSLYLIIEKNGYSYINVEEKKWAKLKRQAKIQERYKFDSLSPQKPIKTLNKNLPKSILQSQSLENSEAIYKKGSDYMLNSLKILKISDNFLPPLMLPRPSINKMEKEIQNLLLEGPATQRKNISPMKNQKKQIEPFRYFNAELGSQDSQPKIERNRIESIRKCIEFDDDKIMENQAQIKLIEWLKKIKQMKEIQKQRLQNKQ